MEPSHDSSATNLKPSTALPVDCAERFTATLNKTSLRTRCRVGGVTVNYRMDGNYEQQATTVYLDNLTFMY
ncbi:MAG TPA: hypothetical protein VN901_19570 [Candidatus Acidoferrales bacterium]|nr:hypothetical protein [Candidatus Acidoferrales bacterium]